MPTASLHQAKHAFLSKLMPTIAYVVVADPHDRAWITSALAHDLVDSVAYANDDAVQLAGLSGGPGRCLILTADRDDTTTLRLVRELRRLGNDIPVIVLGPYSAFRTAVEIARLEATDFLERPVSVQQLRSAVRRACS
ncbi:MAG: response regulator [Variovorax sp.]|nr:MAG: response regulator [Variovorax sp.]